MPKSDKIDSILNLASGKPYQVLNPRPEITFLLHGHDCDLYRCEGTGEILTMDEITVKYKCKGREIDGLPRITGFHIIESNEAGNREVRKIVLLPINKQEVIFNQ